MTPDQARQKIKRHIKNYGSKKDIVVTPRLVRYWWNLLNIAVFYSKIPYPHKLEIKKTRGYHAVCETTSKGQPCATIIMNQVFSTKTLFLNVLVHEMVHAWEGFFHGNPTHGQRFHEWTPRIKRTVNLNLEVGYK